MILALSVTKHNLEHLIDYVFITPPPALINVR